MPAHTTLEFLSAKTNEAPANCLELEREAHHLREAGEVQNAFNLYDRVARLYQQQGEHLKAALCFSQAATCWNIHTGWQPLHHAATRNQLAAEEALKAKHFEYARDLFHEAATLYEKEGDLEKFSVCYLESQRAKRKRFWHQAVGGQAQNGDLLDEGAVSVKERIRNFGRWLMSEFGDALWGYGEEPLKTVRLLIGIIVSCALYYWKSEGILYHGQAADLTFMDALYFSLVTFTTVGFGDYAPTGFARGISVLESLSALVLVPLFLIGLTRRYLRMYR